MKYKKYKWAVILSLLLIICMIFPSIGRAVEADDVSQAERHPVISTSKDPALKNPAAEEPKEEPRAAEEPKEELRAENDQSVRDEESVTRENDGQKISEDSKVEAPQTEAVSDEVEASEETAARKPADENGVVKNSTPELTKNGQNIAGNTAGQDGLKGKSGEKQVKKARKKAATPQSGGSSRNSVKDRSSAKDTPDSKRGEVLKHTEDGEGVPGVIETPVMRAIFNTVPFYKAAPFLPPVNVRLKYRARMANALSSEPGEGDSGAGHTPNGLKLDKNVKDNKDGTYTITMESYTTGKVTTTTETVPCDIVLVLDQSGSMSDYLGNLTRQQALKNAVKEFIGNVYKKYSETSDHRISVVTYATNPSVVAGWTDVNQWGGRHLQDVIENLPSPVGATRTDLAMKKAEGLLDPNKSYSYNGENPKRQKVVVVFTDGYPSEQSDFDFDVANGAISYGKQLKDMGATVYTVGIFDGANPSIVYGPKKNLDKGDWSGPSLTGAVGERWGAVWYLLGGVKARDELELLNINANRFMNFLSSDFKSSTSLGLEEKDWWQGLTWYNGYSITQSFARSATGYYLTASDPEGLASIFREIASHIESPTLELGKEAVVMDVVTDAFDLPEDTTQIKVYTADKLAGKDRWGHRRPSTLKPTVEGRKVRVTGFNFNENFVSEEPRGADSNFYGRKLIIEFTVEKREGFLGGNDVLTNGPGSGIYVDENAEDPIGTFEIPKVNVPLEPITVTATDKNAYLKWVPDIEQLLVGAKAVTKDGIDILHDLQPWQKQYINISALRVYSAGFDATGDGQYKLTITASPKFDAPPDTTPVAKAVEGTSDWAEVHVFLPKITFTDVTRYYGEEFPNQFPENPAAKIVWERDGLKSTDPGVTMATPEPELNYVYHPKTGVVDKDGKRFIDTKKDIQVGVTPYYGNEDISGYTTYLHKDCTEPCSWVGPPSKDNAFMVHVKTASLNLTKQGGQAGVPYTFDVYRNGEPYTQASIVGNGTLKIEELPIGTYTVKENEKWTWRFNPDNGSQVVLSPEHPEDSLTCTNSKNASIFWLNGYSAVKQNIYQGQ